MEQNKKALRIVETTINEFSKEGHGLSLISRQDGKESLVEVPFCIPGDQVKVSLLKRHKGIYQTRLLDILQPSSNRTDPRCMHFSQCGGCRWQQISYEYQLQLKEQWISNFLKPYMTDSTIMHPIVSCSPPWHYRNKVELTFSTDKAMNRYLGFILHASRGKVFNLQECYLTPPWMNSTVHAVREWWENSDIDAYHSHKDTGALRTLTLRSGDRTGDKMVILTVSGNADYALKQNQLNQFIQAVKKGALSQNTEMKLSIFLRIQQIAKGQKTNFYEMQLDGPDHISERMYLPDRFQASRAYTFNISPAAFFQPNTQQAEKLYTRVLEMVQPTPDDVVYDLYCGTGTLGIAFAGHVKEVISIELSPESVLDARENIKMNDLRNITVHQGDVAKILPVVLQEDGKKPSIVIIDPPRAGLDAKAIQHLTEMNALKIAYVSCNPKTQAANLKSLVEAGYWVKEIQPVDQFPQTMHVENIVVLIRKSEV